MSITQRLSTPQREAIRTVASVLAEPPLYVDLDDTLVKTDTLVESVLLLLKANLLCVFLLPIWLCRGRAHLKGQVARRVKLDVATLPYNSAFLAYLVAERRRGRTMILATAASDGIANDVAGHLGLFSTVLGTNSANLTGAEKLRSIQKDCGPCGFVYAGNGRVDIPVWRHAHSAIVVNAPSRVLRKVGTLAKIDQVFNERPNRLHAFINAIRAYQWVKNGLLFVPLVASHQLTDPQLLVATAVAFAAFCLCSSSAYLLNDLLDVEADRRHPTKRRRPFASGDLPLTVGLAATPLFLVAGLALSLLLPISFTMVLIAYLLTTFGYTFHLKRVMIVDVVVLALLYGLRIIGGGAATGVIISDWLLVFSIFLFLSLALLKRYSELHAVIGRAEEADRSRGYRTADVPLLVSMGSASGYMTALVFGLYITSDEVSALHAHPRVLWLVCPLILYWISRAWLLAGRGQMHDDPVVFAIRDRGSYAVGLLAVVLLLLAIG